MRPKILPRLALVSLLSCTVIGSVVPARGDDLPTPPPLPPPAGTAAKDPPAEVPPLPPKAFPKKPKAAVPAAPPPIAPVAPKSAAPPKVAATPSAAAAPTVAAPRALTAPALKTPGTARPAVAARTPAASAPGTVPAQCQPPAGFKGKFVPPAGCPGAAPVPTPSRSHAGQFIFQFSLLDLPYLFQDVTGFNPDTRVGWMPSIGFGYGTGSAEYLFKFGVGVNRFASDTAFMFGMERRNYLGSGVFKGIFFFNLQFGTGSKVTVYQLFNLGVGFQIDPSRRYGFYLTVGPGFMTTFGGDAATGSDNNNDAAFVVVTHFGLQVRI